MDKNNLNDNNKIENTNSEKIQQSQNDCKESDSKQNSSINTRSGENQKQDGNGNTEGKWGDNAMLEMENFLKSTKLSKVVPIFKQRNIVLSEMMEMETEDLVIYSESIGLDVLERNRFIKGINGLKRKLNKKNPKQQRDVIMIVVSEQESNAINKLKKVKNILLNKQIELENFKNNVSKNHYTNCKFQIEHAFDTINRQFDKIKAAAMKRLSQVNETQNSKIENFVYQIKKCIQGLNDIQNKYTTNLHANKKIDQRKIENVALIETALDSGKHSSLLETGIEKLNPEINFDVRVALSDLNAGIVFENNHKVNGNDNINHTNKINNHKKCESNVASNGETTPKKNGLKYGDDEIQFIHKKLLESVDISDIETKFFQKFGSVRSPQALRKKIKLLKIKRQKFDNAQNQLTRRRRSTRIKTLSKSGKGKRKHGIKNNNNVPKYKKQKIL